MGRQLTEAGVTRLLPHPEKRQEIGDTIVPGLYLIVQPSGAKSWAVRYRFDGKPKKVTLGRHPSLDLKAARARAREALGQIAAGIDPAAAKVEAAAKVDREDIATVAMEFVERDAKANRTWRETERVLRQEIIPAWRGKTLSEITRKDVIGVLDVVVDRGSPIMANRVLAVIRRFGNWCVERDLIPVSFAAGVKPPTRERSRDRVLADDELVRVWKACDRAGWPFGSMVRLLILTGQRRDEVGGMRWSEIDLDRAVWTIPADRAKNDTEHLVPLSPAAVDLLRAAPRFDGDLVFASARRGDTPFSGWSKAKRSLDGQSKVEGWRLHDLRRTVATGMAADGTAPHVVEAVLNHRSGTISGVAAVYNRHQYADEKREALDLWADRVAALVAAGTEATPEAFAAAVGRSLAVTKYRRFADDTDLKAAGIDPKRIARPRGRPMKPIAEGSVIERRPELLVQVVLKAKWMLGLSFTDATDKTGHENECFAATSEGTGIAVRDLRKAWEAVGADERRRIEAWLVPVLREAGSIHPSRHQEAQNY